MNTNPFLFLILLCLLAMIWILRLAMLRFHTKAVPKLKTPRPLKSKTPEDCPFCRAEKDKRDDPQPKQALKPWSDVKSPRGRKKALSTQGYACPNQACRYHGIVDERIHALVGYGRHGKTDRIQDLRCQALCLAEEGPPSPSIGEGGTPHVVWRVGISKGRTAGFGMIWKQPHPEAGCLVLSPSDLGHGSIYTTAGSLPGVVAS
jgi:hypothetical protein